MNFGEAGVNAIKICSRSVLEKNTVHIHFTNLDGTTVTRILEVMGSDDYDLQSIDIEALYGVGKITFIFLPGCQFDLKDFQFYKK